jgi:hypothetical protein
MREAMLRTKPMGPGGGGKEVAVYGFFVFPRSGKAVVLEENVQSYLGQPPVWKEQVRWPNGERNPAAAQLPRTSPPTAANQYPLNHENTSVRKHETGERFAAAARGNMPQSMARARSRIRALADVPFRDFVLSCFRDLC